jgi:hypothetical protein
MRVETLLKHESRRFQPEAWQVCHCSAALLCVCERIRSPAIARTTLFVKRAGAPRCAPERRFAYKTLQPDGLVELVVLSFNDAPALTLQHKRVAMQSRLARSSRFRLAQ